MLRAPISILTTTKRYAQCAYFRPHPQDSHMPFIHPSKGLYLSAPLVRCPSTHPYEGLCHTALIFTQRYALCAPFQGSESYRPHPHSVVCLECTFPTVCVIPPSSSPHALTLTLTLTSPSR
jgi:hypothetical protein